MKTIKLRALPVAIAVALTGFLVACDNDPAPGPTTGVVSFDVTDAPVDDVSRVQLTLSGIALKPANGSAITINFDEPIVIDNLLDLQGGNAASVLGNTVVPAGAYSWVRLYVVAGDMDSYVEDDTGATWDLLVPGQQSSGNPKNRWVQLVSGFVVPAGGNVDFTIDVDLRRALTKPASADYYMLRPALRIVDNSSTGTIAGSVSNLLVAAPNCTSDVATGEGNAVYLYRGANNALTGDVYLDADGQPLNTSNPVSVAPVDLSGNFRFGFVAAGDYTLAFTCQGRDDHPETDDTIALTAHQNVTVTAGATATVDLAPAIVP